MSNEMRTAVSFSTLWTLAFLRLVKGLAGLAGACFVTPSSGASTSTPPNVIQPTKSAISPTTVTAPRILCVRVTCWRMLCALSVGAVWKVSARTTLLACPLASVGRSPLVQNVPWQDLDCQALPDISIRAGQSAHLFHARPCLAQRLELRCLHESTSRRRSQLGTPAPGSRTKAHHRRHLPQGRRDLPNLV